MDQELKEIEMNYRKMSQHNMNQQDFDYQNQLKMEGVYQQSMPEIMEINLKNDFNNYTTQ